MADQLRHDNARKDAEAGGHADVLHDGGGGGASGPAGDAAARRMAHAGVHDLGSFGHDNPPGKTLANHVQHLKPGESVCFEVAGNQIYNVIDLKVSGPVTVEKKLVKAMHHGQLGDSNVYKFTLTLAPEAKPGDHATVETVTSYQVHADPAWHFHFKIVCG